MLIVGERLNASRKGMAQAIKEKDVNIIRKEAIAQIEAGADYITCYWARMNIVPIIFLPTEVGRCEGGLNISNTTVFKRRGDFAWFEVTMDSL